MCLRRSRPPSLQERRPVTPSTAAVSDTESVGAAQPIPPSYPYSMTFSPYFLLYAETTPFMADMMPGYEVVL